MECGPGRNVVLLHRKFWKVNFLSRTNNYHPKEGQRADGQTPTAKSNTCRYHFSHQFYKHEPFIPKLVFRSTQWLNRLCRLQEATIRKCRRSKLSHVHKIQSLLFLTHLFVNMMSGFFFNNCAFSVPDVISLLMCSRCLDRVRTSSCLEEMRKRTAKENIISRFLWLCMILVANKVCSFRKSLCMCMCVSLVPAVRNFVLRTTSGARPRSLSHDVNVQICFVLSDSK